VRLSRPESFDACPIKAESYTAQPHLEIVTRSCSRSASAPMLQHVPGRLADGVLVGVGHEVVPSTITLHVTSHADLYVGEQALPSDVND
jgi:hypothetical protein